MTAANAEIATVFEKLPTYTVTFDANGGTGVQETAEAVQGDEFVLPLFEFDAPDHMKFR
ncbi:hypothetical protein [Ruminococcus sp.]|uniref:hypothetical protein n=1 Tax=Ruminococcus sp. TaxID=41978 RepID=UPI0025E66088|nr:hypothetical protein [Ruminococcus sp.]MBQ8967254.1 hypothetical protein [Ruminococcus sp.]